MQIEDSVTSPVLAVNSKAVARRVIEVLEELGTNSLIDVKDDRLDRCLWLLMAHRFGQLARIDMVSWWDEINEREKRGVSP